MTKRTAIRRDPLPGETVENACLEHGPRAFFAAMSPDYGLLVDPDQPIDCGSRVLLTLPDGSRFGCTVITKHPARAKTLRLQILHHEGTFRGCRQEVRRARRVRHTAGGRTMMSGNVEEVDSALLDLEGILHAIELVRTENLNKPGPEFHALAVLSRLAVDQVTKVRLAIFPDAPKREEAAP